MSRRDGAPGHRQALAACLLVGMADLFLGGCARKALTSPPGAPMTGPGWTQTGDASWYGPRFHGRVTASGERYNMLDLTAAHRSLPFGTHVRVTNLANGRRLVVRINDRGPFVKGRILDLSYTAAKILDIPERGVGKVRLEVLEPGEGDRILRRQLDRVRRGEVQSWSDRDFEEAAPSEDGA